MSQNSLFNPNARDTRDTTVASDPKFTVFENAEKALAAEMLLSFENASIDDVRQFADVGAVSLAEAKDIGVAIESSIHMDREAKQAILHKKALVLLAKEKNDPDYKKLLDLYKTKQQIYNSLEKKYGAEATKNQDSLVAKLLGVFGGKKDKAAKDVATKVVPYR